MSLQEDFAEVFDAIPEVMVAHPTFMEIAGFPHYENVCSNILKFFLTPNRQLGSLDGFLLKALLQSVNEHRPPFNELKKLQVKREVVTTTGRIDLLIHNSQWVIAIENKIYHTLINDLDEYSAFVANEFGLVPALKIVLSLRKESIARDNGFVNLTYDHLISVVETNMSSLDIRTADTSYTLIFKQFIQSIKNLTMRIEMSGEELSFLKNNQEKINQITVLNNKLANYISQRANDIMLKIKTTNVEKSVYEGYDIVFLYKPSNLQYKIECVLQLEGIYITICMINNTIDQSALEKLEYFKKVPNNPVKRNIDNTRIILDENIDFAIADKDLIEKLERLLSLMKISETPHEQLN